MRLIIRPFHIRCSYINASQKIPLFTTISIHHLQLLTISRKFPFFYLYRVDFSVLEILCTRKSQQLFALQQKVKGITKGSFASWNFPTEVTTCSQVSVIEPLDKKSVRSGYSKVGLRVLKKQFFKILE